MFQYLFQKQPKGTKNATLNYANLCQTYRIYIFSIRLSLPKSLPSRWCIFQSVKFISVSLIYFFVLPSEYCVALSISFCAKEKWLEKRAIGNPISLSPHPESFDTIVCCLKTWHSKISQKDSWEIDWLETASEARALPATNFDKKSISFESCWIFRNHLVMKFSKTFLSRCQNWTTYEL